MPTLRPLHIVLSYAGVDRAFAMELALHLKSLGRAHHIDLWHSDQLLAGSDRKESIEHHLRDADIIVPLLSPDYLADGELEHAMALRRAEARVVPVRIRPVLLDGTGMERLELLPRAGAVAAFHPRKRDAAWHEVTVRLGEVVVQIRVGEGEVELEVPVGPDGGDCRSQGSGGNGRSSDGGRVSLSSGEYAPMALVLVGVTIFLLGGLVKTVPRLAALGLTGRGFYVLLVVLGLALALLTFGAMRSYGHYRGKDIPGVVILSAPIVLALFVAILGLFCVPEEEMLFDMTVRVSCGGEALKTGELTVYMGTDARPSPVNRRGEADVKRILGTLRGQAVEYRLEAPGCRVPAHGRTLTLANLAKLELEKEPPPTLPPDRASESGNPVDRTPVHRDPQGPVHHPPARRVERVRPNLPSVPSRSGSAQCVKHECLLGVPRDDLGATGSVCLIPANLADFSGLTPSCQLLPGHGAAVCVRDDQIYDRPLSDPIEWRTPCPQ